VEHKAANSIAVVSAAEQLPGLGDAELSELEEAFRDELKRHQQLALELASVLTLEREREEMRKTMRTELERERAELERERAELEREREEAVQCAICLDREKDPALNCGHRACEICARELANCHICRKPITTWTRHY
jgi:hypothetical protein